MLFIKLQLALAGGLASFWSKIWNVEMFYVITATSRLFVNKLSTLRASKHQIQCRNFCVPHMWWNGTLCFTSKSLKIIINSLLIFLIARWISSFTSSLFCLYYLFIPLFWYFFIPVSVFNNSSFSNLPNSQLRNQGRRATSTSSLRDPVQKLVSPS